MQIAIAVFFCILSLGQADGDNAASEFFLGFSKNHRFGGGDTLTLVISTRESSSVDFEVSSPYYGYYTSGTVYPSSYNYFTLPEYLTVDYDTDRYKGIWVKTIDTNQTITVRGMNHESYTADAFLAIPSGPVIDEYIYITNSMLWTNRSGDNFPSLILLVGTDDNTAVTITPTEYITIPYDLRDLTDPQYIIYPGQSYTVTLNMLDTYQIESSLDLTGSQIVSNKPLSVFAGHECTDVPGGVTACDHLFEQVPPTSTWGRFFFLVSSDSSGRISPEWYRMVSSKQHTTITITCYTLQDSLHTFSYLSYIALVGGFEQFEVERDNYCYVAADKAILVMQYAYGGSANNGFGDPFMMMILPTEQYLKDTVIEFWAYDYFTSDITIVVLQEEYPSYNVLLDNISITNDWIELRCSEEQLCGYTLRMPVYYGYHSIRHLNSSIPVAVYVYGFEYYQGYGYPAAMSLTNLEVLECSDGDVRLVDGMSTLDGRVEVCLGGQWGTICNDLWTTEDTDVVCGELGLLSSGITDRSYGEGEGPIHLDNVECLGVELTILDCLYDTHTADCTHSQDVGAVCLPYPEPVVVLQRDPDTNQQYSGYDLTLSCHVLVSSAIVDHVRVAATWFKDDRPYNDNWDSRISVTPVTLTSEGVYVTTLNFSPLNIDDSGSYQCSAVLSGFSGAILANTSDSTYFLVKDLPQTFLQLQLLGVQNCYEWTQASSAGAEQLLASIISEGVEEFCNCGFSTNNLIQIILQCFPDNSEKINVLLLLQETPTSNISQIIAFMNMWINTGPNIILDDDNTTLTIDSDCDIQIIQGSECMTGTQTPPLTSSTTPQSTPTSSASSNEITTEPTEPSIAAQSTQSKGQDLTAAGGVLLGVAIIIIVIVIVIIIIVLIKRRVIKISSFKIDHPLNSFLSRKAHRQQDNGDKLELTENDGNEPDDSITEVVVDVSD